MNLNLLLAVVILVSFIVTVVLAVGSYAAYKLRERRQPRATFPSENSTYYFDRYMPPPPTGDGAQAAEQ